MRIKFLSFIAGFLTLSIAITSCLDSDDSTVSSPDATIRAFALDTIGYGVNYTFTIDQKTGMISNIDSVPVYADTIINKILITTLTTSGVVTMKSSTGQDSLLNINDSIDMLQYANATPENNKYLVLKVWSLDGTVQKDYKVTVNMHNQVPDSLNWGKTPILDNPVTTSNRQKLVSYSGKVFLYTQGSNNVYTTDTLRSSNKQWNTSTGDAILQNADISSIINYSDTLYLVANNTVYNSIDGLSWAQDADLNPAGITVNKLITGFSDKDGNNNKKIDGIAGIITVNNVEKFSFADKATAWNTTDGSTVDADFPTDNLYADVYSTKSGVLSAVVVGNTQTGLSNDTATVVWSSDNGLKWVSLPTGSEYNCPKLIDPSIIYYDNAFYICGKNKDGEGFQKFYTSLTLLTWTGVDKLFMLPGIFPPNADGSITTSSYGFKGKDVNYSIVVDEAKFIWMVGGNNLNKVWRGVVNECLFAKQ